MSGILVERHKTLITFDSPERSYIRPLRNEAEAFLKTTGVDFGRLRLFSKHTTMGLILQEIDELKLLEDFMWLAQYLVPTDVRGSVYQDGLVDPTEFPVSKKWRHNCEDNPLLPPGERDHDMNGDRHARSLLFTQSEVGMDIEQGILQTGRFKGPAAVEFDGGEETSNRAKRRRTIAMTIDEYSRGPRIYPSIELPSYQP
jgi:thiamine phosphate synthase YjbQ (UPF0047 family)